jgi:multiple sugar transport system permease protein
MAVMTPTTQALGRTLSLQGVRVLLLLAFAFPIVFMFVSSFKPDAQIFADLTSWRAFVPVGDVSLDNYRGVFDRVPAGRMLMNSIGVSTITVILGIFINSLAAFALSRMQWRGQRVILTGIIATLIVPFETFALPLVWWVNKLPWLEMQGFRLVLTEGWLDTYQVQVLPFVANAFSIFLFYQYFFQLNVAWGQVMAYASMITVPVLALFIAFQRAFIGSIASAGVKG